MAGQPIASPNATVDQRYVGVNAVASDGTTAARHFPAIQTVNHHSDTPSYVLSFSVNPTVAMDVFALVAPTNKVLRLRRIVLVNPGSATAAIVVDLSLVVADAGPGTGGGAVATSAVDANARVGGVTGGPDPALAAVHIGDTTQATASRTGYAPLQTVSVPAAAGAFNSQTIYNVADGVMKPVTVTGAAAIVLKIPAVGAGAANFRGYAEFTVDDA